MLANLMTNRVTFPDWLREQMEERNVSAADLSIKSGVSAGQISRLLSGTRGATPETLTRIADALGIPRDTIYQVSGVLPPRADVSEEDLLFLSDFRKLSRSNQREVLAYIRMKLKLQKG